MEAIATPQHLFQLPGLPAATKHLIHISLTHTSATDPDVPVVQARRGFEASWIDNLTEINGEGAKEELRAFLAQLNITHFDAGSDTEEDERKEGDSLLDGADE